MSVRIAVVGHVDNGKSTLIGRLLSDTGMVHGEKIEKVNSYCREQGRKYEYAFLLDAFEEEQAQGITMDVTEVQWSYEDRVYTFVDTPGHREFLKKMVSGASRVDAALLIVDALEGVTVSLQRQMQLLQILGLRQVIVLVNKMDLVHWSEEVFKSIKSSLAGAPGAEVATVLPISAWHGENLLAPSSKLGWYKGPSLVHVLSGLVRQHSLRPDYSRFQIQDVYRVGDERVYVGRVESGTIKTGDLLEFAPGRETAIIKEIKSYGEKCTSAARGEAIGITIDKPLFLERGTVAYPPREAPIFSSVIIGDVFWMDGHPLSVSDQVVIKTGTQTHSAIVSSVRYELDEQSLEQKNTGSIALMGRATFCFAQDVAFDSYTTSESTSRFVILRQHRVVGGGRWVSSERASVAPNPGRVLWFTGLSGAGKSTLAQAFQERMVERGQSVFMLDGDVVRSGLCKDLGFSMSDRLENIRRSAEVAKLAADAGYTVLAAFISPLAEQRKLARAIIGEHRFVEVFVDCPLSVCEERDVKGLYAKARRGDIAQFTGIGSGYEPPLQPQVHIFSADLDISQSLDVLEKQLVQGAEIRPWQEAP